MVVWKAEISKRSEVFGKINIDQSREDEIGLFCYVNSQTLELFPVVEWPFRLSE